MNRRGRGRKIASSRTTGNVGRKVQSGEINFAERAFAELTNRSGDLVGSDDLMRIEFCKSHIGSSIGDDQRVF